MHNTATAIGVFGATGGKMKTSCFILAALLTACSTRAQPAIVGTPPTATPGPTITWGAVSDATNYVVAGSTDGTNWTWYYNTTNTVLVATNLPVVGATYYFRGASQGTGGQSTWTPAVQWTPEQTPANIRRQ
jgi:hypothetical protein